MDRKKHINTRNLVIADTFDDFARKVKETDFTVEDIVGYVTSVTRTFYWLNVENVWGVLGFVWDHQEYISDEEAMQYSNPLYRLTQVDADGNNIEMDEQWLLDHKIKKGYGHFNATTMAFSIIPQLPDGYRITEFRDTFNLIESNYIEVQKSNWCNLSHINDLVRPEQSINIDLSGANLNNNNEGSYENHMIGGNHTNQGTTAGATIYIKGDLSGCTIGRFEFHPSNTNKSWTGHHTVLLDDSNKGIGFPVTLKTANQFYYLNNSGEFDIREWLYQNDTPSKNHYMLLADSKGYRINWKMCEDLTAVDGSIMVSPWSAINITPYNYEGVVYKILDPIEQHCSPTTLTIETAGSTGDINEGLLLTDSQWYNRDNTNETIYYYRNQLLNPIIYDGIVNSIRYWNPFCLVRNDNDWPEFNQDFVDKLTKISEYGKDEGYFMYWSYIYITKPSPYVIDCSNLRYLNLFERTNFYIDDDNLESISDLNGRVIFKCLETVKLVNANNFFSFNIGNGESGPSSERFPHYIRHKLSASIRTVYFNYRKHVNLCINYYYIEQGNVVEASWFGTQHYIANYHYKSDVLAYKIRHIDCREYGDEYSAVFTGDCYYALNHVSEQNWVQIEEEALQDIDFMKASRINTAYSSSPGDIFIQPLIATNMDLVFTHSKKTISGPVFIYKSNITYNNYGRMTGDDFNFVLTQFTNKILPGIQPNDTNNSYFILLSSNIKNALTENQISYITNDLNYELKWENT